VLAALRAGSGQGTVDATDRHGVRRLLGFVPLPGNRSGLVLVVGLDSDVVSAQAESRLRRGVAHRAGGDGRRPAAGTRLRPLVAARPDRGARRRRRPPWRGDLAARAEVGPRVAPELRALATAFDTMADRLAATRASLAESEVHHRVLPNRPAT